MKLVLTSNGLTTKRLRKALINMLDKKPEDISLLIIGGLTKKRHLKYLSDIKKDLAKIKIKNISIANISKSIKAKNFKGFDVIFFMGGNTFYLIDRVRKTGFDNLIKEHISKEKVYVGLSAGSIIVHNSIEIAGWGISGDPNLIGLSDLRGLGLTNIAIFPHYKNKNKQEVKLFKKNTSYSIKEIKDGEAVIVDGKNVSTIKR